MRSLWMLVSCVGLAVAAESSDVPLSRLPRAVEGRATVVMRGGATHRAEIWRVDQRAGLVYLAPGAVNRVACQEIEAVSGERRSVARRRRRVATVAGLGAVGASLALGFRGHEAMGTAGLVLTPMASWWAGQAVARRPETFAVVCGK